MPTIQLDASDLLRTRVAAAPDPLNEVVASLFLLRTAHPTPRQAEWRSHTWAAIRSAPIRREIQPLLDLVSPKADYIPDFLTPVEGTTDLESGLDAVLSTPRQRIRAELARLSASGPLSAWAQTLAHGDPASLRQLGHAIRAYHRVAVAPYWTQVGAETAADRSLRAQALVNGGVEHLLATLHPSLAWRDGQIVLPCKKPERWTAVAAGRGLLLVPSHFAPRPLTTDVPDGPVTLVYPAYRHLAYRHPARTQANGAVAALLGRTRAAVLASLTTGCTTTQLAHQLGISLASASQHASVLRDAGLVVTRRTGSAVEHTVTPLGSQLLQHSSG